MKKYLYLIAATLTLSLAACSNSHKKINGDSTTGDGGGGTLPLDNSIASTRDPNINPDNTDYSVLAQYTVHFDFDSFTIKASERPKLEAVAKWLAETPNAKLVIAGHTDNRGTIQYNIALGERRALATRDYLLGLGANSAVLTTISYGKERPAEQGENESAWAANRRAELGVVY